MSSCLMKDSYYSVPTIKEKKQKRKLSASLYYTQPFCACNLFLITTHFILFKLSVTMRGIRKRTPQVPPPAILFSKLLLRMRRMYVASIRLDCH